MYHERDTLMKSDICWTDASEAHVARHGVLPEEVDQATQRPFHTVPGRSGTTLVLGQTHAGRHLLIVLTDAADARWYIVTARDMTNAERRLYRRRAQ
jgi:hypothetical protein